MMIFAMILNCLVVLLLGGLQATLPSFGRRTIFFSVTVSDSFKETPEARAILRQYRRMILLSTLAAEAFAIAFIYLASLGLPLAAVLILITGGTLALARARNQARKFSVAPSAERIAPLSSASDGLSRRYAAFAGALLPFVAAALFAWSRWNQIPDIVALSNAFAVNGALNVMFLLLGVAILHGARRGSLLRSINLTVITGVILTNSIATATFTALRWINPFEQFSGQVFPIAWILALAGIIGWGLRQTVQLRSGSDPTPDECWKLGQFYFNPQDPAYMVERRFGLGYSPNFARPSAWIAAALPLLVAGTLLVALR
jgi:hypothetical protein